MASGSVLAVAFIAATAAIGIGVGMRPTKIDGRRIAAELSSHGDEVECDREIELDASGAAFECAFAGRGSIEFTMTRDGKYAPRADP